VSSPVKLETAYDPVVRRYRSTCPLCGYVAVRAKREAAEHITSQHVAYEHGREVSP
jgi:hypothetical protein